MAKWASATCRRSGWFTTRNTWYLDAWCYMREKLLRFALDAIEEATALEAKAKEVSLKQVEADMDGGYGIYAGAKRRWATLVFAAQAAQWVSREEWHPEQRGQGRPRAPSSCKFRSSRRPKSSWTSRATATRFVCSHRTAWLSELRTSLKLLRCSTGLDVSRSASCPDTALMNKPAAEQHDH